MWYLSKEKFLATKLKNNCMKEHRAVPSLKVSRPKCLYIVHVVFLCMLVLKDQKVYRKVMPIVYCNRELKVLTLVDLTDLVELTYLAFETTWTDMNIYISRYKHVIFNPLKAMILRVFSRMCLCGFEPPKYLCKLFFYLQKR